MALTFKVTEDDAAWYLEAWQDTTKVDEMDWGKASGLDPEQVKVEMAAKRADWAAADAPPAPAKRVQLDADAWTLVKPAAA